MALSEVKRTLKLIGVVALVISVLLLVSSYVLTMVLGPALFFLLQKGLITSTHVSKFLEEDYLSLLPFVLFSSCPAKPLYLP